MLDNDYDELERGHALLLQLNSLLDADPFIDEIGFVHPSEFENLRTEYGYSIQENVNLEAGTTEIHSHMSGKKVVADGVDSEGGKFLYSQSYDECSFWCHNHKLAIAAPALFPVYKAAKHYLVTLQEKLLIHQKPESLDNVLTSSNESTRPDQDLGAIEINKHSENFRKNVDNQDHKHKLMSCTRVLVLINSDYASAWNSRKRILVRASKDDLMAELRLTKLVFSSAPKSEETWVHRRWVIENLKQYHSTLDGVLEGDSKLVEHVTKRSPMNYRAWRHRCWLVSKMSLEQVLLELTRSKSLGASYVADNCCFHYRREELLWCTDLLNTYFGFETLWIHRRFLILQLLQHKILKHCTYCYKSPHDKSGEKSEMDKVLSLSPVILSEFMFIESCVSSCKNCLEDAQRQQEYANTYKLWILALVQRQASLSEGQISEALVEQLKDVKSSLGVICPQKKNLWVGLFRALLGSCTFDGTWRE